MTSGQRFSISLLISTLLFGLFSFLAFTEIFRFVETTFYSPRIVSEIRKSLDRTADGLMDYRRLIAGKLEILAQEPGMRAVFAPVQSRQSIQQRYNTIKLFLNAFKGPSYIRVLDTALEKIHFSTVESDVLSSSEQSLTYKRYANLSGAPEISGFKALSAGFSELWDDAARSFLFSFPLEDASSSQAGLLILSVSWDDLRFFLFERGVFTASDQLYPLVEGTWVQSLAGRLDQAVLDRVRELSLGTSPPAAESLASGSLSGNLVLIHGRNAEFRIMAVLPEASLQLNDLLKSIILGSLYSVLFLVVFLLFSLKSDPAILIGKRIKRLQIQIVKNFLDERETESPGQMREEIQRNSERIKSDIRKSLGRIKKRDKDWVEALIDRSWGEILDLLGRWGPAPPSEKPQGTVTTLTVEHIEKLIREALEKGRFSVSVASAPKAETGTPHFEGTKAAKQKPVTAAQSAVDAEAVEELEEVPEAEDAEAVEEVEELEEVPEAEDAEAAEEVEELEEVPEAEDAEAVEEVEELEEVPEAEDAEVAEEVEELEEVPEAEDAEAVEEVEELEEVPEAEEVELKSEENVSPLETGTLEEAPALESTTSYFPYQPNFINKAATRSPGRDAGPGEVLEELEQSEEVEELQELEDLEELEELNGATEGTHALPLGELEGLKLDWTELAAEVVSFTPENLDEYYAQNSEDAFEEQDGVVQLSEDLFSSVKPPKDEAFSSLVGEVLGKTPIAVFAGWEEDRLPAKQWTWRSGGFDLDALISRYGADETVHFKCLMDLTKAFDAFAGALLVASGDGWRAAHSIGFSDAGKERLVFDAGHVLSERFLRKAGLHLFNGEPGKNKILYKTFHAKDLRYLKAVVFVPVYINKSISYLILGMKNYPGDILSLLRPRVLE